MQKKHLTKSNTILQLEKSQKTRNSKELRQCNKSIYEPQVAQW